MKSLKEKESVRREIELMVAIHMLDKLFPDISMRSFLKEISQRSINSLSRPIRNSANMVMHELFEKEVYKFFCFTGETNE